MPWRSPADQPPWARPALLGVAALAAVLYAWNLADTRFQAYYSMAVRGMTGSWSAFLFGAVDPAGSVTIDKVPGFLWPQALSALVFGFHPWALMLPQVVEGVVSVLVLYRVVRRWAGPVPGLIAAAVFTLTPITAVMFGHSLMEDPALTMCLILAADAWQRAADTGRLRWLLLAGIWVGVGFQAKMLQAWAVLPAFTLGYLVVAPVPLRTRLRQLAIAGAATLAVSAVWVALVTLTPAANRPYVDGSTNNSAIAMVLGYNGLGRFGIHLPGALAAQSSAPVPAPLAALLPHTGSTGWDKLFDGYLGSQAGWLYPIALLALVLGLVERGRAPRTDRERGGYLMWGTWLVATGVAFTAGEVAHATYLAALAAPVAALTGAGLVTLWRAYRTGRAWLLPATVAAEVAWAVYLSGRYPAFLPWLRWIVLALAVLGIGALLGARRARIPLASAGLAAGVAAMLAYPAAWSLSTLDSRYTGTVLETAAGPAGQVDSAARPAWLPPNALGAGAPDGTLTAAQRHLMDFVTAHRDGARYLFATDSWNAASPYVLATGAAVLPMGGFTGQVPAPTLNEFRHLVDTGQLRYVLLSSNGFSILRLLGGAPDGTETAAITGWVRAHCQPVPVEGLHDCAAGA
jgi:4-amino-4-deoxy-L-arabinose transferase-like glycosyltransferase